MPGPSVPRAARWAAAVAALVVALAPSTAGCGWGPGFPLVGSGDTTTQQRPVQPFSSVVVAGAAALELQQADEDALSFTVDANLVDQVRVEQSGETLTLGWQPGTSVSPRTGLSFRLQARQLARLQVQGASTATLSQLSVDRLDLGAEGASSITASGRATDLTVSAEGGSRVDASKLVAPTVAVDVGGASRVSLAASDQLRITAGGASQVEYRGSPRVSQQVSGASTVTSLP